VYLYISTVCRLRKPLDVESLVKEEVSGGGRGRGRGLSLLPAWMTAKATSASDKPEAPPGAFN
jgi:hypothetical protein